MVLKPGTGGSLGCCSAAGLRSLGGHAVPAGLDIGQILGKHVAVQMAGAHLAPFLAKLENVDERIARDAVPAGGILAGRAAYLEGTLALAVLVIGSSWASSAKAARGCAARISSAITSAMK